MENQAGNIRTYSARSRRMAVVRRRKRIQKRKRLLKCLLFFCAALLGVYFYSMLHQPENIKTSILPSKEIVSTEKTKTGSYDIAYYPVELQELLEKNPETEEFVKGYAERASYINKSINLDDDYVSGTVPLLMQWDKRWGYDSYGEDMIGIAGCGPTCLSMAYIYLTGDTEKNPRVMAEFAYENGYYTSAGTLWSLWKEGVSKLGLSGEEITLNEKTMKKCLDRGQVIICSMSPGDFTTEGHFILIRGYGKNGFYVNDPNRRSNSEKQWSFDKLKGQIKCLWALSEK